VAVGEVILGIIGGGVGTTALTGSIAYAKGWLDVKGKREDRRERRFSELFDQGLAMARSDNPQERTQGRAILRSLSQQGKFSELEARLAGDLWTMYAAEPVERAKEVQRRGGVFRFFTRVAIDPGQDDHEVRR
jgi:hypothetical protein